MRRALHIRLLAIVTLLALCGASTFERAHQHDAERGHAGGVECQLCLGYDRSAAPAVLALAPAPPAGPFWRLPALDPGVKLPAARARFHAPRGPPSLFFVRR